MVCDGGYKRIVQYLFRKGVNKNLKSRGGFFLFYRVCYLGNIDIVNDLLRNEVEVDLCVDDGLSFFFIVFLNGYKQIV